MQIIMANDEKENLQFGNFHLKALNCDIQRRKRTNLHKMF